MHSPSATDSRRASSAGLSAAPVPPAWDSDVVACSRRTSSPAYRYTRTYSRPAVLSGGFELYRALDKDVHDTDPTLLMTAQGQLDAIRSTVAPRMTNIVRAVDVPHTGHWLMEENPRFVTAELVRFLDG